MGHPNYWVESLVKDEWILLDAPLPFGEDKRYSHFSHVIWKNQVVTFGGNYDTADFEDIDVTSSFVSKNFQKWNTINDGLILPKNRHRIG